MRLVFDIETNGFLNQMNKIHCIACLDADNPSQSWVYGPDEIDAGVAQLSSASEIIGHNILAFDICAIKKIYPDFNVDELLVTDTLVLSRLIHSDLKNEDYNSKMTAEQFPKKYYGSHSLKAWGIRLGIQKGDFGEQTDWSEWSQGMQDYCVQDVKVNHVLWKALAPLKWSQKSIKFEHRIAELCNRIGQAGWTFDTKGAADLHQQLSTEQAEIQDELQTLFDNWYVEEEFIPKVNNSKLGYEKGVPFIKRREIQFNPNSRKHIAFCLQSKYGWKPKQHTVQGDPKVDESILNALPYPEAKKVARSLMLQKRLGMLADGKYAWMRLIDHDGKLRHTINPNGTVTGRASSFAPNLQQVPATRSVYGKEFRKLFTVPDGYKLIGADLSGIELRVLAFFLQDGGKYASTILEGDIHTQNMHDMGLSDRNQAKTAIYCLIYGGGDARLGEAIGGSPQDGKALRERFYKANPAFAELLRQLKTVVRNRGHLIGLDGRQLPVRGHAQCNVLIQSAAALISKKWIQLIDLEFKRQQLDATIIAWVHDEVQVQTANKEDTDHVGRTICRMAEEAGRSFGIKGIPIEAEYSVGSSWADTH